MKNYFKGLFLQLLWTACKTQNTNLETVGQVFVVAKEKFWWCLFVTPKSNYLQPNFKRNKCLEKTPNRLCARGNISVSFHDLDSTH